MGVRRVARAVDALGGRGVNDGIDWDRRAALVQAEIAKGYRETARQDEVARSAPGPQEDAEGYVADHGSLIKAPSREEPKDAEWRDGEHWSWLFGDSPRARDGAR